MIFLLFYIDLKKSNNLTPQKECKKEKNAAVYEYA